MPLYKPSNTNAHVTAQFSLKGKTAAVTGGVRGIGLAASRALAEAGANVAILYSSTPDADAIASKLSAETGATVKAFKASVQNKDEIAAVLTTIATDFGNGSLEIVVANAGIANHHAAEDYTEEQWRAVMAVNLDGAFWTAQAAGNIFKKQGRGNLIFTASVSAILVNVPQKQAAYNASKAGVVQLARCLSVEWVEFARVNCISPGFIATDMLEVHPQEWRDKWFGMIPAGRLCDPEELKGAYVYLASDASTYMSKSCSFLGWDGDVDWANVCLQLGRIWLSMVDTRCRERDVVLQMKFTFFLTLSYSINKNDSIHLQIFH